MAGIVNFKLREKYITRKINCKKLNCKIVNWKECKLLKHKTGHHRKCKWHWIKI